MCVCVCVGGGALSEKSKILPLSLFDGYPKGFSLNMEPLFCV